MTDIDAICFREVLGVLVDSLAGRLGGVADAVLRPELLRGPTQALEHAHGPPAHLTIEILPVDSRLRLAEDDHALHRHGLLIVPGAVACVTGSCAVRVREYAAARPSSSSSSPSAMSSSSSSVCAAEPDAPHVSSRRRSGASVKNARSVARIFRSGVSFFFFARVIFRRGNAGLARALTRLAVKVEKRTGRRTTRDRW